MYKKGKVLSDFSGFLPVHDCFGVGHRDIETLNFITREVLIEFFNPKNNNIYKLLFNLERHIIDLDLTEDQRKKFKSIINSEVFKEYKDVTNDLQRAYYLIFSRIKWY